MAAENQESPDMSALTEEERKQVLAVLQRAKDFEVAEEKKVMRQPLEGQLYKYTNVVKGWQYRWFILNPEMGLLTYHEKAEHRNQRARGMLPLAAATVCPSDEDSQTFTVNAANAEIYRLRASDAKERQHWVNRLRATAEYHTDTLAQSNPPISVVKDTRPHNLTLQQQQARQSGSTGSVDSDHKVSTISSNRSAEPRVFEPSQSQDAFKNVKDMLNQVQHQEQTLFQHIEVLPQSGEEITALDKEMLMLKATSSATLTCLEQCLSILQQQQTANHAQINQRANNIEWLDNNSLTPGSRSRREPPSPADSFQSTSSMLPDHLLMPPAEPVKINHEEDEEDSEDYNEHDLGAVEEHKSVILHLLSQLKLGMDLTKVVLPTFILEKRSLLEMFADCMAHPDVFLRIPDEPDPESRMMAAVEWYLTSFHAGRKGSIAKKPYNPIIGESFHCSWQVDKDKINKSESSGTEKASTGAVETGAVETGDVETGDDNVQLYYLAEQVSHHPPISSFYFESPQKQICMNASIWTRSKFMGMSIGVVMIGKVNLCLLKHEEDYVFTLPSAYARSILTVPWVELGDRITINCAKTKYSAAVTFHTKPFYGGKLHRVTAEVKNPAAEVTCRISGEWNGVYDFVYTDGRTRQVDTSKLGCYRKRVRPMVKQGDFESRKLWQHVTNSLRTGDINAATQAKRCLEERQRQGEKHRKETNTPYPTKYFHPEGEEWLYNQQLKPDQMENTA